MECLPKSDLFEFLPDTLTSVRKLYGFESADDMKQAVDALESWVKKQKHFTKKDFRREYLEVMIIQCKGSVEKAKSRLDRLCTLRSLVPRFFGDFDVTNDFKKFYGEIVSGCVLPKMTDDHYRVMVHKEPGNNYNGTPLALMAFQNIFLVFECMKRLDYSVGLVLLVDYRVSDLINIVSNLNLSELRNGVSVLQECYGLRVKAIHVLTTNKYIHTMYKFLQAVISPKLMSRIHIHETMNSVYEFIPIDLLPIEYGGKERSIDTLLKEFTALLSSEEQRAHIRETLEARTDERLRSKEEFNSQYLGMPGTFRALTVD